MMRRSLLALSLAALLASPAAAQYPAGPAGQSNLALVGVTAPATDSSTRLATTAWANSWVASALPLLNGRIWVGSAGNIATPQTPSGDLTMSNVGAFTFNTVNGNVGAFGSATQCATVTVNAKGLITAASQTTCTPALGSITGFGTGVAAALAIATGNAGAPVLFNGALGTPSSGNGSNLTALNATQLTTGTIPAARLPLTSATLQGAPSNPTNTTSASLVMMGLGVTTCRVAPVYSTRMRLEISGVAANTGVNGVTSIAPRYNTGAGPANGAAVTGTTLAVTKTATSATANATVPFSVSGIATGLSPGTTYWFDVAISASAGTSAVLSLDCQAMEF